MRESRLFDFRPHRWTGKLGSGNDEWFFMPLRIIIILGVLTLIWKGLYG